LIRREADRVWLDLDDLYPPPLEQPNTVFKAWSIACRAAGGGPGYTELMGVSAAAFRIQVGQNLCPSSPHPHLGFDCGKVAQEALGLDFKGRSCEKDDEAAVQEIREMVVESIDAGRPVLVEEEETGLAVGYTLPDHGILVRHPYSGQGDDPVPLEHWPWMFATLVAPPVEASPKALKASLEVALELAHAEEEVGNGYRLGFEAYHRWIRSLADEDLLQGEDVEPGAVIMGNAHIYYCLVDARRSAVGYLNSLVPRLPDTASDALGRAAGTYDEMVQALNGGWSTVCWPQQVESADEWTMEQRRNQAALLEEVVTMEREAVAELGEVLAAL
jgi:hypothetical protein